jgi:6-phosphofructokinase 1
VTEGGQLVFRDLSRRAIKMVRDLKVDALVCIGGDGTLGIAHRLHKDGVPVVGVPKTIDNDLRGTDVTFGFDTAVAIATEAIDRLHTTAQSHHRIMIVEVMGHWTGWIALYSGVAGGGDIILSPIPGQGRADKIEESPSGLPVRIVVIAEGAKLSAARTSQAFSQEERGPIRLGGVGFVLQEQLEKATGREARTVVLGHLLWAAAHRRRRVLSTTRVPRPEPIMRARRAWVRSMACDHPRPAEVAAGGPRRCPGQSCSAARTIGTSFGEYRGWGRPSPGIPV